MEPNTSDLIDEISLRVFSQLEKNFLVSKVERESTAPASLDLISSWEKKNPFYPLPDDLKRFYYTTNGLSVKWYTKFKGIEKAIGHFFVSSIDKVQLISIENFASTCRRADRSRLKGLSLVGRSIQALILERSNTCGDIALVYLSPESSSSSSSSSNLSSSPEVWLRDLFGKWNFLATNFSNYYRMMLVHLGLESWQLLFTDLSVDPFMKPWFHLFIPKRLALDEREMIKYQMSAD